MRKSDAIQHFGSATAVAKALGIGKAFVSKWGDEVPQRYAYEIERLTHGALEAEWPPPDRPNMVLDEGEGKRRRIRAS
jgi:DNA-binding transcriptional regulator YdaS (Cro superfamily)